MCTTEDGPPSIQPVPWWAHPAFPQNGLFTSTLQWERADDGSPLALILDTAATSRLQMSVRRAGLKVGDTFQPTEACTGDQGCQLVIGPPDIKPPSQPHVSMKTLLVRNPSGAFTCGDTDYLMLTVDVQDDTTPHEHIMLAAYIAGDPATVAAMNIPTSIFGFDRGADLQTPYATVALGDAAGHVRGSNMFSTHDMMCVSISAIDWAGNESQRSDVTCVDTDDPNDPSVEWVDGAGCCSSSGGGGSIVLALVTLFQIGRQRLGRRRCTS